MNTQSPTPAHALDTMEFSYRTSVEGDAAAAICGHHLLRFSNVDALDEFHGFVQEHLARLSVAVITEARAAAIEECVKWHEEYARSEDNRALSCRDQHNDAAYHATLAVAAKHRGYAAELRAIATQPAQSGE